MQSKDPLTVKTALLLSFCSFPFVYLFFRFRERAGEGMSNWQCSGCLEFLRW